MSTWTWDPGLQWRLDYFSMVDLIFQWDPSSLVYFITMVHTYPWDLGSLVYFSTMVHTYPWDPGIGLYTLITSVEDNTFIRGMKCSVAGGNNMGYLGRYPRGVIVYKY